MRKLGRGTALVLVGPMVCLALAYGPTPARTASASPHQVADGMARRSELGLNSVRDALAGLIGSRDDVGTAKWGIPMTAEEAARVDLPGRMAFADEVDRLVLSRARGLATYAGAYIDQFDGGNLVVRLTSHDAALEAELAALTPPGPRSVRFELAAFTERQLVEAAESVADKWPDIGLQASLLAVRVDEAESQVVVEVDGEIPPSLGDGLRASLSVPVDVRVGLRTSDAHCVSRSHCDAPTRAGIRLWKGVVDAVHECGLGAHIRVGTNERFVTSGHCGYTGSNNWLHKDMPGSDVLGAETGVKLYVNGGQDIMMVELDNDAQSSDDIYGCCLDIVGMGSPIQFEVLCTSRAQQQDVVCGTVTNTWMQYKSDTPDPDWWVWGADLTITAVNGDSGSPIWRDVNDVPLQVRAIGVLAAEFGEFARLNTSLDDWGASVVY